MHEGPTLQNAPEKPNSIEITHKAISIFLLHVRHDKVSLSKQITISDGFLNYHLGMPRQMIKNSPFSRRMKVSWYASFYQSHSMKSRQYVSALPTEKTRLLVGELPTEKIFNVLANSGQLSENDFRRTGTQNSFRRFSFWNHTVITYSCGNGKIFTMLRILLAN